ncbi:MAG: anthranilate synthase component II [Deltaproteobacteria bacterium]|nr:anthranilate synthase component II [Deltaproteobacteria bacterium]
MSKEEDGNEVRSGKKVILIDNRDSFTFNLAESFTRLGCSVRTYRNSANASAILDEAIAENALIALSPGPGGPEDAGCCQEVVHLAAGKVPVIGICLGHQVLVHVAGGEVKRAQLAVHGSASEMEHDGQGPFKDLQSPVRVARYHSLCSRDVPVGFTVHAELEGMAMAISDDGKLQVGLQFHPESILTPEGDAILQNVLTMTFKDRSSS